MVLSTSAPLTIVIATNTGLIHHSLLAFLSTLPNIQIIGLVSDVELILTMAHENLPDVLILDANLSKTVVPKLIKRLKSELPELNCIVLANNVQQQELCLHAGASHALLKGFLGEQLTQAVLATTY